MRSKKIVQRSAGAPSVNNKSLVDKFEKVQKELNKKIMALQQQCQKFQAEAMDILIIRLDCETETIGFGSFDGLFHVAAEFVTVEPKKPK